MTENQLKYLAYQENVRHNLSGEEIERGKLGETSRANLARETETARSNLAHEAETQRSNLARETETNRSNLANEALGQFRNTIEQQRLDETKRANRVDETRKVIESGVNVGLKLVDALVPG